MTGLSRGTGFVSFKKQNDCEKCLFDYDEAQNASQIAGFQQASSEKSILRPSLPGTASTSVAMFSIDGRFINVTLAVSKDIAISITEASNKSRRAADKRNLYLMREGVIFPGSEAAAGLLPQELDQRTSQYANRKRLLATNPNLFISKTRLSVRGLGNKTDDAMLRAAAKSAVKGFWEEVSNGEKEALEKEVIDEEVESNQGIPGPNRKVWVKQAKVIRDMDRMDKTTQKPKSKGYGFIEFTSHADALACLRFMNNNSEIFKSGANTDKGKKLVVEFAVENNLILKKRANRQDSAKTKEKGGKTDKKRKRSENEPEKTSESKPPRKKAKEENPEPSKPADQKKKSLSFKERRDLRKEKMIEKSTSAAPSPKVQVTEVIKPSKKTKPSRSESKLAKKNSEDSKFETLLSSYRKKVTSTIETKLSAKKWYE